MPRQDVPFPVTTCRHEQRLLPAGRRGVPHQRAGLDRLGWQVLEYDLHSAGDRALAARWLGALVVVLVQEIDDKFAYSLWHEETDGIEDESSEAARPLQRRCTKSGNTERSFKIVKVGCPSKHLKALLHLLLLCAEMHRWHAFKQVHAAILASAARRARHIRRLGRAVLVPRVSP